MDVMLHPEGMRLPRDSPSSQVLDPGPSRRDVGAASPLQIPQTPNLCPLLAFFCSFFCCHWDQRQANTDIKWLPGSPALLGCLLPLLAPGAAQHRPPGLILPRTGTERLRSRGRRCRESITAPRAGGMHPAVLHLPVPSQATPCPILSPAVDIAAGSSRALAAPPSPQHPHIPQPPGAGGDPCPPHPRPQLCPAAGRVAVTKAQRGRGDPAIALGTFVPYSLPETVDFVPSLGAALGRVWRRWHGPKSPRDLAPDSR